MLTPLVGTIEAMGEADVPIALLASVSSTCSCARSTKRGARTSSA